MLLGVGDERELLEWQARLKGTGIRVAEFREPDIGDALTAIAAGPTIDSRPFRKLELLTMEEAMA